MSARTLTEKCLHVGYADSGERNRRHIAARNNCKPSGRYGAGIFDKATAGISLNVSFK